MKAQQVLQLGSKQTLTMFWLGFFFFLPSLRGDKQPSKEKSTRGDEELALLAVTTSTPILKKATIWRWGSVPRAPPPAWYPRPPSRLAPVPALALPLAMRHLRGRPGQHGWETPLLPRAWFQGIHVGSNTVVNE